MGVLSNLEPNKVFKYFEEICSIPHGSNNVKEISNYLVDFAKERSLKYRQDESLNVVIWKDGSKGYENAPGVIIQGHIDMVAVKTNDCDKDMSKEGLELELNDDIISAKGTSLGGDDGIAVAFSLALLDDDTIEHPPIEAIFTTNEEIGMLGAAAMDTSDIKGRLMLNMDSEVEGVFTVSCAGGATVECRIPYKTETTTSPVIEIKLDHFKGGHSGVEIDKGRLNAAKAMGRILLNVFQNVGMRIVSINGGEKDNAIPKFCETAIAVLPESIEKAKQIISDTFDEIKNEYSTVENEATFEMNVLEKELKETFAGASTLATIISLVNMPNGIQRMNPEMKDMVQTSLNLGILRTEKEYVSMSYAVRSSVATEKQYMIEQLKSMTEIFGGEVVITGPYPGWEYNPNSRLKDVMIEEYKKLYNKEPVVEGIHAGLECGLFASKLDGLDAISYGPNMENIHTTNETLSVASAKRTWELTLNTLKALK